MSDGKVKAWFKSKTIWANLLMSIAPIIDVLTGNQVFSLDPEIYAVIVVAVNFVLRFVTKEPVSVSGK